MTINPAISLHATHMRVQPSATTGWSLKRNFRERFAKEHTRIIKKLNDSCSENTKLSRAVQIVRNYQATLENSRLTAYKAEPQMMKWGNVQSLVGEGSELKDNTLRKKVAQNASFNSLETRIKPSPDD